MTARTKEDVRALINRHRRQPVTDEVWEQLRAKSLVEGYLRSPSDHRLASLVGLADRLARSKGIQLAAARRRPLEIEVTREDDLEIERVRVFSTYLSRLAEQERQVKRIRHVFFGDTLLSNNQAEKLKASVAARTLPHSLFVAHGIPLLNHEVAIQLPDVPAESNNGERSPAQVIHITWGNQCVHDERVSFDIDKALRESAHFLLGKGVLTGSALDDIREACLMLTKMYGWDEVKAAQFLLTGDTPEIPLIGIDVGMAASEEYVHSPIWLRVQPWTSPRTVARIYQRIQKTVFGAKRKAISRKNLALFEFGQRYVHGGGVTWEDLRKEWNCAHSEWAFTNYRAMRQEFERCRKQIAFSGRFNNRRTAVVAADYPRSSSVFPSSRGPRSVAPDAR